MGSTWYKYHYFYIRSINLTNNNDYADSNIFGLTTMNITPNNSDAVKTTDMDDKPMNI
jgi:hypothetical protein